MTETWKAVRLARYVTGPVSAAGAVGCQTAVLIGNAVIAALSLLGVALRCGMTWPTLAVALFSIGMIGMGGSVFLLGRARLGRWLGTRMAMVQGHGSAFDEAFLKSSRALGPATFFESCARLCPAGSGSAPALCRRTCHGSHRHPGDVRPAAGRIGARRHAAGAAWGYRCHADHGGPSCRQRRRRRWP